MKKVLAVLFILFMFYPVCSAFQRPDPTRWLFVGENQIAFYWIDSQSMKFYSDSATVCMLSQRKDETVQSLINWEMDFLRKMQRILNVNVYDANWILVGAYNTPGPYTPVQPGSINELVYGAMEELYQMRKENGL